MKTTWAESVRHSLKRDYLVAVRRYLRHADESNLASAYELGRQALEHGLGVVEFATLHIHALGKLMQRTQSARQCSRTLQLVNEFFIESLSPFEMTHRGYGDAQATLRRLNQTLEAEARRVAHALHDEAGQLLVTVHFALQNLATKIPPNFESEVEEVRCRLIDVEKDLRRISHELRPPMLDELGLIPALDFMAEGVSKRSGIHIVIQGVFSKRLPNDAEIALYRSVHEAVTNAVKHAQAKSVAISLRQERQNGLDTIICSVKDNGIGLKPGANRGLGLLGMQERIHALGGSFEINSRAGIGTELLFSIPRLDSESL